MTTGDLDKLAVLIRQEHQAILTRWRKQVRELPSARNLDIPTLNDHVPDLLDELAAALESRSDQTISEAVCEGSPPAHGRQRVQDGFDIEEVVAEYNILRDCIFDLAGDKGLSLQGKPFRIVNRVLDGAIGSAVQTYATQQALDVQHRREEYLAFVAHDLRTPLNAISLATRVLELTLPVRDSSGGTIQMLKALNRNVQQLEGLVNKVLEENANLQTEVGVKLQRRAFDLWPIVESLIHDLHPLAKTATTQLINRVPDDMVIFADADLLRRVFQNLIANAIRYTPRGEVVIGAREIGEEGTAECWVSDTGAGIPEEFCKKIFDKGETNPENEGGMGLGLAIVKTFIEAHGGMVTVDSKTGIGSTFRFSLPARTNSGGVRK